MDNRMSEEKNKLSFLSHRIILYVVLLFFLLGAALILLKERISIFPKGRLWYILAILLCFTALVLFGYFWILKPYSEFRDRIRRFSEGYLSLAELSENKVTLSPEVRELIESIGHVVSSTHAIDLSKRQAQYRALQNQINPHFLYNTLDGIRSEALLAGLDNLADMTEALAVFFRYTISKSENLVTVEEELENCRTYFKIQQYRFGNRLSLEIDEDSEDWPQILRCMIPKLTLQPILENSIIHGTELKLGEGITRILIEKTETRLIIRVSDNGVGMEEENLRKLNTKLNLREEDSSGHGENGGVALSNVNNRIRLIFGEEYGMHVYSLKDVGTNVEITIPVTTNEGMLGKRETV